MNIIDFTYVKNETKVDLQLVSKNPEKFRNAYHKNKIVSISQEINHYKKTSEKQKCGAILGIIASAVAMVALMAFTAFISSFGIEFFVALSLPIAGGIMGAVFLLEGCVNVLMGTYIADREKIKNQLVAEAELASKLPELCVNIRKAKSILKTKNDEYQKALNKPYPSLSLDQLVYTSALKVIKPQFEKNKQQIKLLTDLHIKYEKILLSEELKAKCLSIATSNMNKVYTSL